MTYKTIMTNENAWLSCLTRFLNQFSAYGIALKSGGARPNRLNSAYLATATPFSFNEIPSRICSH